MQTDYPFPEALPALARQFALLAAGAKPAVLVPHWAPQLAAIPGPAVVTPAGVVWYDPLQTDAAAIHAAVAGNRLGEVLGYGIPAKPEGADRAVTLHTAQGDEIVSVVCDAATEPRVRAALARFATETDSLTTEPPLAVLRRRATWWKTFFDRQPEPLAS